jgi:hypothetical protein
MKKYFNYIVLPMLLIALVGCNSNTNTPQSNVKTNNTTTIDKVMENQMEEFDNQNKDNTNEIVIENNEPKTTKNYSEKNKYQYDVIDIDLTTMSSDMIYSTVYQMMMTPNDYIGKIVKIKGTFNSNFIQETNKNYYVVLVEDATACCSQGIEFIWNDDEMIYPDDYPELGEEIVITGEFQTYMEQMQLYCHLEKTIIE